MTTPEDLHKCPHCHGQNIYVDASVSISVNKPIDTTDMIDSMYYDRKSGARCQDCQYDGELRDFE